MLYYALVFLVVGVIAGASAWPDGGHRGPDLVGFVLIGIVLLVIHLVTGRRVPPAL